MTSRRRARRIVFAATLGAAGLAATAVCLEGLASWAVVAREALHARRVAERAHTRYDAELGWVSRENASLPDLYGPGVGLHTNAWGARGRAALAPRPAPGRQRVACSGDSFTLGYGVRDEDAWCAQLERLDPRLEPVNLGQGGYGLEQSFLWWRRQAARVGAGVHVFTLNQYLLDRLTRKDLQGYGKPTLALRDGRLEVENIPVPATGLRHPWLPPLLAAARRLRLVEAVASARGTEAPASASPAEWAPVVERLLADLDSLDRSRGTRLLVVFLPRAGDAHHDAALPWRSHCRDATARLGIRYLDLVPPLRALSRAEIGELFLRDALPGYAGSEGHYSVAGNAWVAKQVLAALPPAAP